LLGVTGGVAAYKAAGVARLLTAAGARVSVVMTESATRFVGSDTFSALTGEPAHTSLWERPGEVLHVRLAHEADVAAVVPATANAIAKLAHGLADDLLSSTLLEASCPLVIAPAMHTGMWEHPATRSNVDHLVARGVRFVGPAEGPLAHGDEGVGRLAEPEEILDAIRAAFDERSGDLTGHYVVVTAGPTHEPIDPVRFVGNRSSGKMGVAVAAEAERRGARVTLVLGPGTVAPPAGVEAVRVETAEEMRGATLAAARNADAVVMAAAVADFRPKAIADSKIKKDQGVPELVLEPTPDILRELGESTGGALLVGFAAETSDVEAAGREKLREKHLDLLVANSVGHEGTGFGADTNDAAILSATGDDTPMRSWTKLELASAIVDRLAAMLRRA
jgi:phosphopantothenoylcysteine decarboxylase / phosphopantothenate---cysteine ligase